jgi:integrase/recombinase XerD
MNTNKLDPWTEGYLEYLRTVRRLAPKSLVDKRCTLKRAIETLHRLRPDIPLWKLTLEDYVRWVNQQRDAGYSTQSISKDLSHIRGLLDYAWRSGRSDRNVLDGFQLQDASKRQVPRALSIEQARQLVEACPSHTALQRRNRLIILLLYGCGLRTAELCQLDVNDIDLERQEVVVRKGKGERSRRIPVPDAVWTPVLAYLAERKGRRGALLRTAEKRVRIAAPDVCDVVREAAARAAMDVPVTPKTLRHSFATHLMDRGVDLAVIASLMGHRSPRETGVYLHRLPGRQEAAVKLLTSRKKGSAQ